MTNEEKIEKIRAAFPEPYVVTVDPDVPDAVRVSVSLTSGVNIPISAADYPQRLAGVSWQAERQLIKSLDSMVGTAARDGIIAASKR